MELFGTYYSPFKRIADYFSDVDCYNKIGLRDALKIDTQWYLLEAHTSLSTVCDTH